MKIRKLVLVGGASAFLSAQAAFAAPLPSASAGMDPLVSLSVLASAESHAAVCAGTAASTAAASAATTQNTGQGNCVLPVTAAPAPVAAPPAAIPVAVSHGGVGALPLLLGLVAIVGIAAALASGGHAKGNLTPVSPA